MLQEEKSLAVGGKLKRQPGQVQNREFWLHQQASRSGACEKAIGLH